MGNKTRVFQIKDYFEMKKTLAEYLAKFENMFPVSLNDRILIKPNLNSNMNALTGNTTDLRILAAIIEFLKKKGYTHIIIGEGTNSGFHRSGINVIKRLRIDSLAKYYGVNFVDFNYSDYQTIPLEGGIKANIAKECLEADFFINVPKLKTHFETEMTVCLKSLIGCLVGRENKKKTHSSLIENILRLNEAISPDLQVVDGLIAMEGTGPSLGTPRKIDTVIIGTDPFLIDMVASKIAGYEDFKEIPVLLEAFKQGKITKEHVDGYETFDGNIFHFKRPECSFLVAMTINPWIQKYLIKIRYAPFVTNIFNLEITRKLLFNLKISQDFIVFDDGEPVQLELDDYACDKNCNICKSVCPLENDLPKAFSQEELRSCLNCLYCYSVCPRRAIKVKGNLGFFEQQTKQYDTYVRKLFEK